MPENLTEREKRKILEEAMGSVRGLEDIEIDRPELATPAVPAGTRTPPPETQAQAPAQQRQKPPSWNELASRMGQQTDPERPPIMQQQAKGAEPGEVPFKTRLGESLSAIVGGRQHDPRVWSEAKQRYRQAPIEQAQRDREAQQAARQDRMAGMEEQQAQQQTAQSQRMQDPGSPESQRARELLKQMGIDAPETVTAAQFAQFFPAHQELLTDKRLTQKQEAERKQTLEERRYEEWLRQQGREEELEDYKRRRAAGFPFDVAISAARGAQAAERKAAVEEAKLRARADAPLSSEKVAEGARKFGEALEKTNVIEQTQTIKALKQAINEAKEAHDGQIFPGGAEAVRRGPRALRGLADPASRKVLQLMDRIQNMELRDRSGAAVTSQEFERYKAEVGSGVFDTERELERAIDMIERTHEAHQANVLGQFTPEMVNLYHRNRQQNIEAMGQREAGQGQPQQQGGGKVVIEKDGRRGRIPRSRLEEAQRDGWRLVQ